MFLYERAKDRSRRAGAITVFQFLFCVSTLYFVILVCVCMKQQKMNFSSRRASSAITAAEVRCPVSLKPAYAAHKPTLNYQHPLVYVYYAFFVIINCLCCSQAYLELPPAPFSILSVPYFYPTSSHALSYSTAVPTLHTSLPWTTTSILHPLFTIY